MRHEYPIVFIYNFARFNIKAQSNRLQKFRRTPMDRVYAGRNTSVITVRDSLTDERARGGVTGEKFVHVWISDTRSPPSILPLPLPAFPPPPPPPMVRNALNFHGGTKRARGKTSILPVAVRIVIVTAISYTIIVPRLPIPSRTAARPQYFKARVTHYALEIEDCESNIGIRPVETKWIKIISLVEF